MKSRRARLREVADKAGVAFITAWRALNDADKVSAETRRKVELAAEDIGYVPNMVARSLVSSTTGIIGVVVPTVYDSIFADTVQGVADVVRPSGSELMIGLSGYDADREAEIIKAFLGRQIDGLVLTGRDHTDGSKRLLASSGIPIVETWDFGESALDSQIGFSSFRMAYDVTKYLIDAGYERIAFASPLSRARAVQRQQGYRQALSDHRSDAHAIVFDTTPDLAGGARTLEELAGRRDRPDAIFFNGDTMAIGALLHAPSLGVTIPDDIGLFGVHDLEMSRYLNPTLSSVRIPRYEMGVEAARHLLARIGGIEDEGCALDLGFTIVNRGTTA